MSTGRQAMAYEPVTKLSRASSRGAVELRAISLIRPVTPLEPRGIETDKGWSIESEPLPCPAECGPVIPRTWTPENRLSINSETTSDRSSPSSAAAMRSLFSVAGGSDNWTFSFGILLGLPAGLRAIFIAGRSIYRHCHKATSPHTMRA